MKLDTVENVLDCILLYDRHMSPVSFIGIVWHVVAPLEVYGNRVDKILMQVISELGGRISAAAKDANLDAHPVKGI